jgi:hypothetical protein
MRTPVFAIEPGGEQSAIPHDLSGRSMILLHLRSLTIIILNQAAINIGY